MVLSDWLLKQWLKKQTKDDKRYNFIVDTKGIICPYCLKLVRTKEDMSDKVDVLAAHLSGECSEYKGKSTPLAEVKSLAGKKKDGELFFFIEHQIKTEQSWRIRKKTGTWFCPYCAKPTSVTFPTDPKHTEAFINDVIKHLNKCYDYSKNPDEFRSVDEIKAMVVRENKIQEAQADIKQKILDNDERFTQMDDEGTWICPFCLKPVQGINVSTELLRTVNAPPQIAGHLFEHCPVEYGKENIRSLQEVQDAAASFRKKDETRTDARSTSDTAYLGELRSEIMELKKEMGQDEEIKQSLEKARNVVSGMLPSENPRIEGYEFATFFQACTHVGGDFYDFISLDENRIAVVVGDVSGHGLESALVMGMVKKALNMRAKESEDIVHVLSKTNSDIFPDIDRKTFITIFFGVINTADNSIQFLRAGHNYSIVYKKKSGEIEILKSPGMPLGVADGAVFTKSLKPETFVFESGDIFVQYTDGLTEAMNPKEEEFEMERFTDAIQKFGKYDADYLITKTINTVKAFTGNHPQSDDMSMIAVKRSD